MQPARRADDRRCSSRTRRRPVPPRYPGSTSCHEGRAAAASAARRRAAPAPMPRRRSSTATDSTVAHQSKRRRERIRHERSKGCATRAGAPSSAVLGDGCERRAPVFVRRLRLCQAPEGPTATCAGDSDQPAGLRIGGPERTPVAVREPTLERQQPLAEFFDFLVALDFIAFGSVDGQHVLQGPVVIPGFEPDGLRVLFDTARSWGHPATGWLRRRIA